MLLVQIVGANIIMWKTWAIPVAVDASSGTLFMHATFWVLVDSGCLLTLTEAIALTISAVGGAIFCSFCTAG